MSAQRESMIVPGLLDERPTRHAMLERLEELHGTWVASGDYFDGQQVYPDRKSVHTYEWTCAGQVLVWRILSHGPLKFYQSHCALVWSAEREVYRASYYDSLGTADGLSASWVDARTLEMQFDTGFAFLGPAIKRLRNVITRHDDGTQLWRLQADRGTGWESIITQNAYRLF